jgi:hypothetical protein
MGCRARAAAMGRAEGRAEFQVVRREPALETSPAPLPATEPPVERAAGDARRAWSLPALGCELRGRPAAVYSLAFVMLGHGIAVVWVAIAALTGSVRIEDILAPDGPYERLLVALGGASLFVGLASVAIAWGLWKGARVARYVGIAIAAFALLSTLVPLVGAERSGVDLAARVAKELVIPLVLLYGLLHPTSSAFFRRSAR